MDTIHVLVVDDHPMFRNGLSVLLNSLANIEWLGDASTGEEAVALALRLQPDVILMDIQLPGINGIDAARQILRDSPHIGILVLTMYEDDDLVFAAMQAGARGYLLKGADQEEIVRAIQAVGQGEAIFSPAIARRLMSYFSMPRTSTPLPEIFPELTEREREILDLIASGCNNSEIANKLVLSSKTVRNHVSNILHKLQVADRAQAIIRARNAGLGNLDRPE
jgi:DNA-binding NarL/FixJ family response regulator